ncbi:sugar ABC transporter ATP-binding protein [Cellulomonas fengjieae]|uniref:sugar ABC transporter ATP-binding protein n=1 Tax=Cellulomonas fengjieae TaxID=2819978 RepID=UPI001AAE54A3|nr:sugar ABC transporter ATP-binding protein [Cellulomonas fengjieae]MBO3102184.1 sugar ABC transporter ATP-binding protein [Cellulomonas fengjieae]
MSNEARPAPTLYLEGITKSFGANRVLKGVDLTLQAGRVTALLGANGAGKSTLIKVLSGVHAADGGRVLLDGAPIEVASPQDATRHGIQTVHQRIDDSIIPGLTVAENLLFEEIVRGEVAPMRSLTALLPRAREIAATLQLGWSDAILRSDVYELGIAESQLLLLARALVQQPKVLVLDEPTSTLSAQEADRLFALVGRLREAGVAILYVSHRLAEVRSLADDVVVLRDGRIIDEQARPFDMARAVSAMLGERVVADTQAVEERRGETVAIHVRDARLLKHSGTLDLDLRYGEVTGVIGLIGAGKTELARGLYGAATLRGGRMTLDGAPHAPRHPKESVRRGVYLVPEDRASEAMLPGWSIARTMSLPFLRRLTRWGAVRTDVETRDAAGVIDAFGVVAMSPDQPVDALSGGNQQKVVVARWMNAGPRVLLLDEPFRGVDIGARRDISHKARERAAAGACVVVLVSDVDELREAADRIVVLVEGEVRLDAYTSEISNDQIITSMSEVA